MDASAGLVGAAPSPQNVVDPFDRDAVRPRRGVAPGPPMLPDGITAEANRATIWTHHDAGVATRRGDRPQFAEPEAPNGTPCRGSKRLDPEAALSRTGFSGGPDSDATWLERRSPLRCFEREGFDATVAFDHLDHQNGPALAIRARGEAFRASLGARFRAAASAGRPRPRP